MQTAPTLRSIRIKPEAPVGGVITGETEGEEVGVGVGAKGEAVGVTVGAALGWGPLGFLQIIWVF